MDILAFRDFCLSLPRVEECTPFDETTLVFKVGGKMFAYTDMVEFQWVALKCDPEEAIRLREEYHGLVEPAYHGNKKHWNGVDTTGRLTDNFVREQVMNSYLLAARGITPRALRDEIAAEIAAFKQ